MGKLDPYPTLCARPEKPLPGARFKAHPEDFIVEEVPLYEPCGKGDHVYFWFEKRNISTLEVVKFFGNHWGIDSRTIGIAGLKDSKSFARQHLSIEFNKDRIADLEPGLRVFNHPQITLLKVKHHGNKIKIGHLRGNRFRIRLRLDDPARTGELFARCESVLAELARRGMPNYFGDQRFGRHGNNALLGKYLVQNDMEKFNATQGMQKIERKRMLRLLVSAYQAELFNRILARRMPDIGKLVFGDLAQFHRNRACFTILSEEDAIKEQPRADAFEISPSGPMYGPRSPLANGVPGDIEREMLKEEGVEKDQFGRIDPKFLIGSRRVMRAPFLEQPTVKQGEGEVELAFALPAGAFATVVIREIFGEIPEALLPQKPYGPENDPALRRPLTFDEDAPSDLENED